MSSILGNPAIQEPAKAKDSKPEKGFTNALLFAYQQILECLEGQKKDQLMVLTAIEDSIALQQAKNEQLNELDYFLAKDVKGLLEEDWKNLSEGGKDAYRFAAYCFKNHLNPLSQDAQDAWSRLPQKEKEALASDQEAYSTFCQCNEAAVKERIKKDNLSNEVMIKNEGVTKKRDYITNQIVVQQQRQQVLQTQSQTTVSSSSQSTGLAESLMGILKTLAEQICYKVL